jgi:hypothetical protein
MLTNNDQGDSLTGHYTAQHGYYTSLDIRDAIAEQGGEIIISRRERKSYPIAVELSEKRIDSLKNMIFR